MKKRNLLFGTVIALFLNYNSLFAGEIWHRYNNQEQNYSTNKQLVDILVKHYPSENLDINEEQKQNPNNKYQDGVLYAITNSFGHTTTQPKRKRNLFDSNSLIITPDFKVYPTLDSAINSNEFKSMYKRCGHNDTMIQEFTIGGKFLNLYDANKKSLQY